MVKCPICDPVIKAMETYSGSAGEVPPGETVLPKEIEMDLANSDREARQKAITNLVDRYVSRAFDRSKMTKEDKEEMKLLLRFAEKTGMSYKKEHTDLSYPGFGASCPSCTGATRSSK